MARVLNPMTLLRPADRSLLLRAADDHLIGLVLELNRTPRYQNRLDALQLVSFILRRRHKNA